MHSRKLALVVAGAAAALLLSGCTFSLTPQIPEVAGSDVATVVEDRLEEEVGSRPDVDCGEDSVKLEVGNKLTCVLTDPATGLEYDVVVSFTQVKGTDYTFDFKVADSPNNPPDPNVDPDAPEVSGDDIAALVVTALTPQLTAPPQVSCPEPTVTIAVDNTTYCTFDDETGPHDVEVTITKYDPATGNYSISAKILED
ncbi:MAG TPA: DUF4333 domain-containing protein [Pseudolysinimonas sp.]|nr:DUF4333 domain-containing protein [Pseudolysinimonas sp.]